MSEQTAEKPIIQIAVETLQDVSQDRNVAAADRVEAASRMAMLAFEIEKRQAEAEQQEFMKAMIQEQQAQAAADEEAANNRATRRAAARRK